MRATKLFRNEFLDGWTVGVPFELPGLLVQPPQRAKFFITAELRFLHGRFEHLDRLVVDLERHRKWVSVLAAMCERKSRRIGESARRAMHHFCDHRQGLHRPRADAGSQQQIRKILRPAIRGGSKVAVKPPFDHIAASDGRRGVPA